MAPASAVLAVVRRVPRQAGLVALCAVVASGGAAAEGLSEGEPVDFSHDHLCSGSDEQYGPCEEQPACGPCTPVDCQFANWQDWYPGGGCSGLRFRERRVRVASNECGLPCQGAKIQSERHLLPACQQMQEDCLWAPWSDWSECDGPHDQANRTRSIWSPGSPLGHGCTGSTEETRPCDPGEQQAPCHFSAWEEWTKCSATCGEGRHTRMRSIESDAANGGKPCNDALLQTAMCQEGKCPVQDCKVAEWSGWSACSHGRTQRYRSRTIIQVPLAGGVPCPKMLVETEGCGDVIPHPCELTTWTEWSDCDKTCDGGQTYRERRLKRPNEEGGLCERRTLRETIPCETGACFKEVPEDCKFDDWSEWSDCSVACGQGEESRKRTVKSLALIGGKGCSGRLEELRPCERHDCFQTDCKWGDWYGWSACSDSCGGGEKRRSRVVEVAPTDGGKLCEPNSKTEVVPCNTEPCQEGDCVDGRWGEWTAWTECSATCSTGFRSRRRDVEVQPSSCGKPAVGLREQFEICENPTPCVKNQDCELSEWGDWSHCSCTCFGVRERNRYVTAFASGRGKPCLRTPIKVVEPCNPGVTQRPPQGCGAGVKVDCVLSDWHEWMGCSMSCGGGQRKRSRSIHIPPRHGGKPCNGTLIYTAPCNINPCGAHDCEDCLWGAWSEWGGCSSCGGQKFRHRAIERMPNECGKPCEMQSAKETTGCDEGACDKAVYCSWNEWSGSTACASCGASTSMRNRAMYLSDVPTGKYLFKGLGPSVTSCAGSQLNVSLCPVRRSCAPACRPKNCSFAAWSDWSEPTWASLCERHRGIVEMNNECGQPCGGALLETRACRSRGREDSQDCMLSQWSEWTVCLLDDAGQRYRSREIMQNPRRGGLPCEGELRQTRPCAKQVESRDCELSVWSYWGECSSSCGTGQQERARRVQADAAGDGEPCDGSLKEMRPCVLRERECPAEKPQDCVLSDWTAWSICDSDNQRYRERSVAQSLKLSGAACTGGMKETETCTEPAVDCMVSAWTSWSTCDATCGGGQAHRQRQIQQFPEHGGLTCPHELIETHGCNNVPCNPKDCQLSEWSDWSGCSKTCGIGHETRNRKIKGVRGRDGTGCQADLGQMRACATQGDCAIQDCEWSLWSDWGSCSCSCGGGTRSRSRSVEQAPENGGMACPPGDKEQVEPCNTQSCDAQCQDGEWADWGSWSPCSRTCAGGVAERRRAVSVTANDCGREPVGKDLEERLCNVGRPCEEDVDCRLTQWTHWSDCSASCSGVKRRSRHVARYGRGLGKWCVGALQETWPCNPGPKGKAPKGCFVAGELPQDCELGDWRQWSICSASCDGGQNFRSRDILHAPSKGGRACAGPLAQIQECGRESCGLGREPVDCKYNDWQDWGACRKCNGERKRFRRLLTPAKHGGKNCKPTETEQVQPCPWRCHERLFCTWRDWNNWGHCSTSCGGGGHRKRRRALHLSRNESSVLRPLSEEVLSEYEAVYRRTQELEEGHMRELLLAFAGGGASLMAVMAAARVGCVLGSHRQDLYRALPLTGNQPEARSFLGTEPRDDPEIE